MAKRATPAKPAKPAATMAKAQSRSGSVAAASEPLQPAKSDWDDSNLPYCFGDRLRCASATHPYQRKPNDPLFRTVSIFTSDPAAARGEGSIEQVKLPYEPLNPGPAGSVITIENTDGTGFEYADANLDDSHVLLRNGYAPSLSSPQFQAQMVYAVTSLTYDCFRLALGRPVSWAFKPDTPAPHRLTVKPYGEQKRNAWYDAQRGELVFGYFKPKFATPVTPPETGIVYTSLSHDIIVHEMSHALLDGLRSHFLEPTHKDVLALHEAFADLMAFFQQFKFDTSVRAALTRSKGVLVSAHDLVSIAREFGQSLGLDTGALRTLVDVDENGDETKLLRLDDAARTPHERGSVLVRAVVSAFSEIYAKRTKRFVRLAQEGTRGGGEPEMSDALLDLLVRDVAKLASQFQSICIRAIDYCPPVDVRFGDYLRALVTADMELVPNDDLGYRETLIRAFGKRGIYGQDAPHMTEDALRWRAPTKDIQLDGDNSNAIGQLALGLHRESANESLRKLAIAIGDVMIKPEHAWEFGLISPHSPDYESGEYERPVISSIAIARRIGLDQQLTNDLVAEITQRRTVTEDGETFSFYGGSTIIMDYNGRVRFAVRKRVNKEQRVREQSEYMAAEGASFWETEGNHQKPLASIARKLCAF